MIGGGEIILALQGFIIRTLSVGIMVVRRLTSCRIVAQSCTLYDSRDDANPQEKYTQVPLAHKPPTP